MRNKGIFSKLVWLVLVMAFVAIAGGGCNGSSSGGGGGDEDVDVTHVGTTDHPLADFLREHLRGSGKLRDRIKIIGNKATLFELKDAMPELKEAFEAGKIIGIFGPTQGLIDELRAGLGVPGYEGATAQSPASAADRDKSKREFFMIMKHDGIIYENEQHFIDDYTPGAEQTVSVDIYPSVQAPERHEDCEGAEHPEPVEEGVHRARTKLERYPEIAASIASWHERMAADAANTKARSEAASRQLRAAAGTDQLTEIMTPVKRTYTKHLADIDDYGEDAYFRFPFVEVMLYIHCCYSFDEKANYYLIESSSSIDSNQKNYDHARSAKNGGADVVVNSTNHYRSWLWMGSNGCELLDHSPTNVNETREYTHSVTKNISGNIGAQRGSDGKSGAKIPRRLFNLGVTGGITVSNQKTLHVQDFEVRDSTSTNDKKLDITYLFSPPLPKRNHFFYEELDDATLASRSAFFPTEFSIWKVDRAADQYQFAHKFEYHVLRYVSSLVLDWVIVAPGSDGKESRGWSFSQAFDLPVPPTIATSVTQMVVNKRGRMEGDKPVKFSVFSDGDWKLECDADWVVIGDPDKSGTATKEHEISVSILDNHNPEHRYATIYVTGTKHPKTGEPQVCAIDITQEPDTSKLWTIFVDPDTLEPGFNGGTSKINVRSEGDWIAWCKAGWVKISPMSGDSTGITPKEITLTVDANTGDERYAEVVVRAANGQYRTIDIIQPGPVFEVDRTDFELTYFPGPQTFNVLSDTDWTASCSASWVTLSQTQGGPTGSTPQEIRFTMHMNTGPARSADIVVRDSTGRSKTIHVQQGQGMDVSTTSIAARKEGGVYKFKLRSSVNWSLKCDADWIHIYPMEGGPMTYGEWKEIEFDLKPTSTPTSPSRKTQIIVNGEYMNDYLKIDVEQK